MIKITAPNGETQEFDDDLEPKSAKQLCELFGVSGGWFQIDFSGRINGEMHCFVIDGKRYAVISKTISGIWPKGTPPVGNCMFDGFEQIPDLKKEEVERRLKLGAFI